MNTTNLHLILINLFIVFFSFTMMGCNKVTDNPAPGGDHLTPEEIKEQAFLGLTVPFLIQEEDNGIYTVGLAPHARPFTFNEKLLNGTKQLKLLRKSMETGVPLKVYVYQNTNDIWWVEEATDQIWDSIVNKEWSNLDNWAGTGLYFYEEENNLYCIYMVYGSGVPVAYHFTSSVSINEDEIKIFLPINIESGMYNNELDEKEVKEILFKFEDNTIKYGDLQFNISDFNSITFITSKKE